MADDQTVFVIDDDGAVRDSVQMLLESAGYRAEIFESALVFLDKHVPGASGCVLADVRMPDMSGLELQAVVNERRLGLPVIIMTGHADVPMAVRAMKAGAVDFIEKPFSDNTILDSIKRALEATGRGVAAAEAEARIQTLTPREREVLERLVAGSPNKVVAYELDISPRTVEIHRARVMEKMQASSLPHLVRLALAAGVIRDDG